jgi:hypothetical protein
MSQNDLQTRLTPEGLLIVGGSDGDGLDLAVDAWRVTKLANRRLLVFAEKSAENPSAAYGVANCSSEMLYDLLFGLNHRRWSGMVVVDVGFAKKKLYFSGGECVFAASDLMDDRLGEVIYREAIISMEQLANFAVQVDRKTKFGQVLLKSGEFNNTDLWNALKYQVRDIFFSVFLAERCYLEVYPNSAPVEIAFEEGTESLLETAFSYGSQFRAFKSRIEPDRTKVSPTSNQGLLTPEQGTFIGDIMELCKDSPMVGEVLARSKLNPVNTLVALQKLAAKGFLQFEGLEPAAAAKIESTVGSLKSTIDGYQVLHQIISSTFAGASIPLPTRDLSDFALSLNSGSDAAIYLDANGALLSDSVNDILQQCAANRYRINYFRNRLGALTRYLLQVSGDMLPPELAKNVRKEFQEIIS